MQLWCCLGAFFVSTCLRLGQIDPALANFEHDAAPLGVDGRPGGAFALSFLPRGGAWRGGNGGALLLLPNGLLQTMAMLDPDWVPAGVHS